MARQRNSDALKNGVTGATLGATFGSVVPGIGTGIGAGIGGGLGALGGYFGLLPGSGQDDGQADTAKRLADIQKAQAMLGQMQSLGVAQRRSTINNMGQIYKPMNDRLARLYGEGARVNMPTAPTPVEQARPSYGLGPNVHRAAPVRR